MDSEVKASYNKIKQWGHEIAFNRRMLASSYNIDEINLIEGKIRDSTAKCNQIRAENKKISSWLTETQAAKDKVHENGFYDNEVYKLKESHRNDKQKIRELYYDTLKKRKQLIEKHDVVVRLEKNIRKMKELIDNTKKDKESQGKQIDYVKDETELVGKEWDVEEILKKVNSAKQKLKEEKANTEKQVKEQDQQIYDLEYQNKLLHLKVKEKDKELSLADLKIKELKRNLRYNTLKPLPSTPGNLTSRKRNNKVRRSEVKSKSKGKNNIAGKRNSIDDYTRISSNMEMINENAMTGSEIRLEKSESSILSTEKNQQAIYARSKKTSKRYEK